MIEIPGRDLGVDITGCAEEKLMLPRSKPDEFAALQGIDGANVERARATAPSKRFVRKILFEFINLAPLILALVCARQPFDAFKLPAVTGKRRAKVGLFAGKPKIQISLALRPVILQVRSYNQHHERYESSKVSLLHQSFFSSA